MVGAKRRMWMWLAPALAGLFLVGCPIPFLPALNVSPLAINFGATATQRTLVITNEGLGAVAWTVREDVDWLTVDRQTGVTTANQTTRLTLTADRTGLALGTQQATLDIVSSGGVRTVNVALSVQGTPSLLVSTTNLNILDNADSGSFTITNDGDGLLVWSLTALNADDPTQAVTLDSAFTISPSGETLAQGETSTVTVEVDHAALEAGTYRFILRVHTSVGDADVLVTVTQGLTPVIAVDTADDGELSNVEPPVLDFGENLNTMTMQVFNTGPAGSELNFTLTSDRTYTTDRPDLIGFTPAEGTSAGTNGDNYDPVPITVVVYRDYMTSETDGATITIEAPGADPVEVVVNVQAPPLTFEGAMNRSRAPFIMRFVFLIRDTTGKSLDTLNSAVFNALKDNFSVEEDGLPLDPDETNLFISSAQNLRYDVAFMLDYTGSLYQYLQTLNPGSADALQELYAGVRGDPDDGLAAAFLNDLPDNFSVGLFEHHERQQANRVIHPFTTERDSTKADLDAFYIPPADHGASELYDALTDACEQLAARDEGVLPLDDADVRALVFITDGRDTSSVETATTVIQLAKDNRVRLYPIGFGENVDSVNLLQLATETGGHYYAAPNLAELARLLESDTTSGSGTQGLVVKDLSRQLVLTYNTLFQDGSHTYLVSAEYNGIQGSFERDGVFATGGDIRAGQLTLHTNGIQEDGSAVIYLRTPYVPRNITQFRFRFLEEDNRTMTVERASDGLLDSAQWFDLLDPIEGTAPVIANSLVKYFLTNEDNPLQYGAFGDLLKITITGYPLPVGDYDSTAEFAFQFWADNRIYLDPPFTKFFQYPNVLKVGYRASSASVAPLLVSSGFDPDVEGAWDNDDDGVEDFEDVTP